ncbi:hypothetical protein V6Z88_007538 [Aspergillus fumigatus]
MARSYQMSSQRLKLNAVGHVLLAFLGVIGLLSLFSNHHRIAAPGATQRPPTIGKVTMIYGNHSIYERNLGDTQGAQSATGLPPYSSAKSNPARHLEQTRHSSVSRAPGTGKAGRSAIAVALVSTGNPWGVDLTSTDEKHVDAIQLVRQRHGADES